MEIFIIIVLLIIAAETTYLTINLNQKNGRIMQSPVFVDTSVLIDGRIIAVAESGFISRPLYIPRSVVGELQFLADNADSDKRSRARHGLDIITQLQNISAVKAVIFNDGVRAKDGVDNRLLELAKKHGGSICTIDYNLNKVAVVEGLEVLNVNELAKSLRMAYLPGETTTLELTQKGNDSHQGVGHLSDGTMVVVEHAYKQIGSIVEIEFIRSLQTAAGKMMFAKLTNVADAKKTRQKQADPKKPVQKALGRRAPSVVRAQSTRTERVSNQSKAQVAGSTELPAEMPQNQPQRAKKTQQAQATRSPKTADTSQRTQSKPSSRPNRRRSPEDSMVELANRS